ncbi:hypothetical protein Ccrd_008446 [Cynara cardunculus var. scolymus]|uniref:Uncharacterized protein n=1 Tax=Cynara cardunculus var. scolymus TaxID=59895 RepID=A0A103XF82_CYNCS|nr:hypothetical protein Ccrd_008446 [Cynara cardunculus var. scolymus]
MDGTFAIAAKTENAASLTSGAILFVEASLVNSATASFRSDHLVAFWKEKVLRVKKYSNSFKLITYHRQQILQKGQSPQPQLQLPVLWQPSIVHDGGAKHDHRVRLQRNRPETQTEMPSKGFSLNSSSCHLFWSLSLFFPIRRQEPVASNLPPAAAGGGGGGAPPIPCCPGGGGAGTEPSDETIGGGAGTDPLDEAIGGGGGGRLPGAAGAGGCGGEPGPTGLASPDAVGGG